MTLTGEPGSTRIRRPSCGPRLPIGLWDSGPGRKRHTGGSRLSRPCRGRARRSRTADRWAASRWSEAFFASSPAAQVDHIAVRRHWHVLEDLG